MTQSRVPRIPWVAPLMVRYPPPLPLSCSLGCNTAPSSMDACAWGTTNNRMQLLAATIDCIVVLVHNRIGDCCASRGWCSYRPPVKAVRRITLHVQLACALHDKSGTQCPGGTLRRSVHMGAATDHAAACAPNEALCLTSAAESAAIGVRPCRCGQRSCFDPTKCARRKRPRRT